MNGGPDLALVASLVGDTTRANILAALLDGRALTASELAYFAHVSPQTASGHLAKLTDGKLLTVLRQGRNRYYRLATPLVGQMLEGIMAVAAQGPQRHRPASKADDAMRMARTCYDHFAGKLGVGLADNLIERGYLVLTPEAGEVTERGAGFLGDFGVDLAALHAQRRTLLPSLPRLDRAPAASRRHGRCRARPALLRSRLVRRARATAVPSPSCRLAGAVSKTCSACCSTTHRSPP